MYLTCLAQQVDIVCGDGHQAWYFRSENHKIETTDTKGNVHLDPLNGLVNTVARVEVARLHRGQPLDHRVCMEYIENNSYDITECPESHYDLWDCCFIQLYAYGMHKDDQRATERAIS